MKVGVLFSGGKDSVNAVEYCKNKGWEIEYLLSVKPSRTDCYIFHFATVEHTRKQAEILELKHIITGCKVANPKEEAEIVKEIVEKNKVDAIVLGGVGLQETQIRVLQEALLPIGVEVFASHDSEDEEKVMEEMIEKGYRIILTEVAAEGLTEKWLGREITKEALEELKEASKKHGFSLLGEGGMYNTYVLDAPFFGKSVEFSNMKKVMDTEFSGYVEVDAAVKQKAIA